MRGSIKTLAIAAIIFFGVGEFLGGWNIGIAAQTPMFLYNNIRQITITRRARAVPLLLPEEPCRASAGSGADANAVL